MVRDPKTTLVVYYSRSHHSERLADEIAIRLDTNTYEIEADRYYGPVIGYLRAGFDSLRGKLPTLTKGVPDFRSYDSVVICGPVWTSYPATPIRAFLKQYGKALPEDVALFLTNGDHSPAQKAFAMATELLGHPFKVVMSVSNEDQDNAGIDAKVTAFCAALRDPKPHLASA